MHKFNGREYPCCASLTMGIIGGKWKTLIPLIRSIADWGDSVVEKEKSK